MQYVFNNPELEKIYNHKHSSAYKLDRNSFYDFSAAITTVKFAVNIADISNQPAWRLSEEVNGYKLAINKEYQLELQIEWHDKKKTNGKIYIEDLIKVNSDQNDSFNITK